MAGFNNHLPPTQEPTVEHDEERGETHYDHPAYAKIGASQISGRQVLFGSDFEHNGFVEIRVKRAQYTRRLSNDWFHGRDEVIAVRLSHAQWATFVSSMNMGDGVPCTLMHLDGEHMPRLPEPTPQEDRFKSEHAETLTDVVKRLDQIEKLLADGKLTAGVRNEVLNEARMARQEIKSNLPFVEKSFAEHVEEKIETAKVEIHGYVNMALRHVGIEAIAERRALGEKPAINIEDMSDGT